MSAPKSRMRIAGRRVNGKDEIKKAILDLIVKQDKKIVEVAEIIGKSRAQVSRYVKELKEEGKFEVTATGRILRDEDSAKEYVNVGKNEFVNEYDCVKKWVDSMLSRRGGHPIKDWATGLGFMKKICDILKVKPCVFHVNTETAETYTKNLFAEIQKSPHPPKSFKNYTKWIRNFAAANGVSWQRGIEGIMTGKKERFGAYGNIQLNDPQINQAIDYAFQTFGLNIATLFAVGKETFARMLTLLHLKAEQFEFKQFNGMDYVIVQMYEAKTSHPFPKLIIDPVTIQLLRETIKEKPSGFLFGNGTVWERQVFAPKIREIYRGIGIDVNSEGQGDLINYWKDKPFHALRHIGAHLWLRRTGYNYAIVAAMGWEDITTLMKVYGQMPFDYVFDQGTCYNCKPPTQRQDTAVYCSLKCAITDLNRK